MISRGLAAVGAQGASSASTLLLSATVARSGGVEPLGELAIVLAAYLITQACMRDGILTPILTGENNPDSRNHVSRRVSLAAVGVSVALFAASFAFGSQMLLILSLSLHGMLLLDYSKVLSVTLDRGLVAIAQEAVVFIAVVAGAVITEVESLDPLVAFAIWSVTAAITGYLTIAFQSLSVVPGWNATRDETLTSSSFALQSLVSKGSVNVLTMLIPLVSNLSVAGTLRGGSTILGPANLTLTSLQPLLVRRLARLSPRSHRDRMRFLLLDTSRFAAGYGFIAAVMLLIGHYFGDVILGDAWSAVQGIIWLMALDGFLVSLAYVPSAFHRSVWRHQRALIVSVVSLSARFPLVLVGAASWGAAGAAAGFAVGTAVSMIAWWTSSFTLSRRIDHEAA